MLRVIPRPAEAVLVVCALCALLIGVAAADVPAGPRLAVMREASVDEELLTVGPAGDHAQRLAGGRVTAGKGPFPILDDPLSWSSDGRSIIFAGVAGRRHHRRLDLYVAAADGTHPRRIPGTAGGFNPILSPDGHTLAFARERKAGKVEGLTTTFGITVWLLDMRHGPARQITPWREDLFEFPSSFSPDGSTLAITRKESGKTVRDTAVALHLPAGGFTVLAKNAAEPVYSPDGGHLALLVTGKERHGKGSASRRPIWQSPTRMAPV